MSDKVKESEDQETDDSAEGEVKVKKSLFSKKRILVYGATLLFLLGGGAGGAIYLGLLNSGDEKDEAKQEAAAQKPSIFYDLPDITVNLNSIDQRSQYLRLKVALEIADRDTTNAIVPMLPRVLDTFQVYLRELRTTDLEGSAGIYRLKEELRRRVNLAVYPAKINDILFKELLIQ